jgi:glycosyltransferase involved in cell wall biosynthesis
MWALRLTEPLCEISTFVSEGARSSAIARRSISARKAIVVPNGVHLEQFDNLDQAAINAVRRELRLTGFVWIAVGRLVPAKDHLTLLAAFAKVAAEGEPARLVIVGDGVLRMDLEAKARELGIADMVRFTGLRHDIPVLLGAANGFVSSSAWEGLPLALIEAAAAGLPVVATAVGGSAEVVTGTSGALVEPANPAALAAEMLRLAKQSEPERHAMGHAARAQARRFDLTSVVDRWHQLFMGATSRAAK